MTTADFQAAVTLIAGGLSVWSLQQIREVLLEVQLERREALEVEATFDNPEPPQISGESHP